MNIEIAEMRNEQMSLKQKKYFCKYIKDGATWNSFKVEFKTKMKRQTSRSTYQRLKKDADSILETVTHRAKRANYKTKNEEEKKKFESHCKDVILACHQRRFVIKLSEASVADIMMREALKFDFPWLKELQFHKHYIKRFMKEYDLLWSSKKSDQEYISPDQMNIHRIVI